MYDIRDATLAKLQELDVPIASLVPTDLQENSYFMECLKGLKVSDLTTLYFPDYFTESRTKLIATVFYNRILKSYLYDVFHKAQLTYRDAVNAVKKLEEIHRPTLG